MDIITLIHLTLAILSPRFVETPLPYIGVLLTLSIDIIFDSPTLQIADVFYGRPLSQKNEIAKKGKNVVMTSKTHYFVSLLLLLPYLEELKKSSSTLQAANPVHLKVLLFHAQCWHIWCPSMGQNLARSTH